MGIKNSRKSTVSLICFNISCNFRYFFRISNTEWLVVIICIGMVVASEIINSSIEELVNFISPERNQKAGLIKDLAAAAVLVTAVIAAVCGLIIFIPKLV